MTDQRDAVDAALREYAAARARGEYTAGSYCSLDPNDWQSERKETVYFPLPDVILGYGTEADDGSE